MGTLVLAGRYEILEKIGDGGMAVVYKARDRQLNRFVAIKILKKEFISDQTFVENFIREAKAAASLLHPNIVTIHDAGKDRDIYYIVMEYIEGKPLSDIIALEAPLDYRRCIRIAKQMASALGLAHRNNIIHRDVKPHNILITSDGTAKITDFGIAKAVSDGTIINDSGVIMGSVHYFSPEQSRGQYVDEKSDIYSLGIVLYEMITGRVPFDADNPVTIAVMHMNDTIIPPSKLVKGVPPGLDQIVMKATAKYQSDRFASIDDMYKALDNVNIVTGIIDDPKIAGLVLPTNLKEESPGQGYSNKAEQEELPSPRKEDIFDDYADEEEPDYRRKRSAKEDRYIEPDDDDYYDDYENKKKAGLLGGGLAMKKGLDLDDEDIDEDEKRGGPQKGKLDKRQKLILIIAAVAVAVVLSIPLSKAIMGLFSYEPVMVPDVIGLYVDEATDILVAEGFSVDVKLIPLPPVKKPTSLPMAGEDTTELTPESLPDPEPLSDDGPQYREGQVMDQDPKGGETVKPGSTVTLKVAGPPEEVEDDGSNELGPPTEVPDLIGKTKASAEYAIVEAGFQVGGVSYDNSDLPVDTVMKQSPEAGEMAPGNSRIHITISLGPKEETVEVPNLRGMTEQEATTMLKTLGLQIVTREVIITDITKEGRVLEQIPAPNTNVKPGSNVTVDIGVIQRFKVTVTGGTGSGEYRQGDLVTITAQVPAGQQFAGWSVVAGGVTLQNNATATFNMPGQHVTITANFSAIMFTVRFLNWDNTVIGSPQQVPQGGNATAPPNPSRSGWTFTGWSPGFTNVQGNLDVRAQFTENVPGPWTVRFFDTSNNLMTTLTVPNGQTPTPPDTSALPSFSGWSPAVGPIYGNTDFYAQP